jgi:hypothetical protein
MGSEEENAPFGSVANAILHDLGFGNGAGLLEELLQLASTEASGQLLDEDGPAVTLIRGRRRLSGLAVSAGAGAGTATALLIAAPIAAIVAVAAVVTRGSVVPRGRAGAGAPATATGAAAVEVSVGSMTT